ncbi:O-methyltransferase [Acinetobacter ursingii]|uniref:O-methyltransferase n=1 Tax=Acinetobacter ursingii TaxID=108980 RepID=UPI0021D1FF8D|nr:O-methyltransferase [Acinetobacter ursingii]MCU4359342.1 O-methyltransferase [Acinetobacter ursingii]
MLNREFLLRLSELYDKFQQHDAKQSDHLQRFRNIEPDSAQFLSMLIRTQQSKSILEIGTSTGYSTLWLAEAAQATGANIVTLEIEEKRSQQAKNYAQELKLDTVIEFWVGDAARYLQQAQTTFDFILLDAERSYYPNYWNDLKRLMRKNGGVLMVDNVISHAAEVKAFLNMIKQDGDFLTSTISFGAGLFMVVAK